ncbi:hypothetical protein LXA43DRAFT_287801 [Ganoderma leucocontextum]|nr:hypothetical protein LXA43DRAFT_287801 [Ganoderma leucocontextum]
MFRQLGAHRRLPVIHASHALKTYSAPKHAEVLPQTPRGAKDRIASIEAERGVSPFLVDTHNRQHNYLRISLTERCNLRCAYLPSFLSLLSSRRPCIFAMCLGQMRARC